MSYNKSPLAYDDIIAAFERALNSAKGIRIPCVSRGAAVVLRSRFNYYRTLNREENSKTYDPTHPMWNRSVYDRLVLRIPPKGTKNENVLFIEHHLATDLQIEEIL